MLSENSPFQTSTNLQLRHREEAVMLVLLRVAAAIVVVAPIALITYLGFEALHLFTVDGVSLRDFLFSPIFDPDGGHPGVGAFIVGSIAVTAFALALGSVFGLGMAIFLAEFSPPPLANSLRLVTEVLAGIPSVVFGWLGLSLVVPLVRHVSGTAGFGILPAACVLGVMILPTLVSLSIDALRAVPVALRENSYALGATRWETLQHVVIPSARKGLTVAIILATARAIGETLAVQMVIGNAAVIPHDLIHAAATLPTEIVLDVGGALPGSLLEHALFAMAFLLLVISTGLILVVRWMARRAAHS